MIATLTLGATTLYCLSGWCVAEYRNRNLRAQVEAYQAEDWHTSDDMAAFAGRCAWHVGSFTPDEVPPMVEEHHADAFRAGFAAEKALDDAAWVGVA